MSFQNKEVYFYEDEHVLAYFFQADSTCLVISFCDITHSGKKHSWGAQPLQSLNYSYVGIVSTSRNWFPETSIRKLVAVFDRKRAELNITYRNIITYGHSQGGYAAIRYASIFNATSVLSFSPQFSIAPSDMEGKDSRFHEYYLGPSQHSSIKQSNTRGVQNGYIFFDPRHDLDLLNIQHIAREASSLRLVRLYSTFHSTIRLFASKDKLGRLIQLVIDDQGLAAMHLLCRQAKRAWPDRKPYIANSMISRNLASAGRLFKESLDQSNAEQGRIFFGEMLARGQQAFLRENMQEVIKLVGHRHWQNLVEAYLCDDMLGEALALLNAPEFLLQPTSIDPYLTVFNLAPGTLPFESGGVACFAEGWYRAERWGRWGKSIRSRLYINTACFPDSKDLLTIPAKSFAPAKQSMSVRIYDAEKTTVVDNPGGVVKIHRSLGRVIVDFHVDKLYSPFEQKSSKDTRLLGASVGAVSEWKYE